MRVCVCARAWMHGTTKQRSIGGPKPHRSLSAEPCCARAGELCGVCGRGRWVCGLADWATEGLGGTVASVPAGERRAARDQKRDEDPKIVGYCRQLTGAQGHKALPAEGGYAFRAAECLLLQ